MKKLTLLIVEDEYYIGQLIANLLHFDKLDIELIGVFNSSAQAYSAILLNRPDIVIVNIKMPVMDGQEIVKRTMEDNLHPHFIFISRCSEFEYVYNALKYSVDDFLLKPVKEDDLNAVLQHIRKEHFQKIQHEQEIKHLQEEAHQDHILAGMGAILVLAQADQSMDWESFNALYHVNFQQGALLAFEIKLDYQQLEQMDDIQERLVVKNIINMAEHRLHSKVREQLYAINKKATIVCLLNYPKQNSSNVRRELYTLFVDAKQYLCDFPEFRITMALGDETDLDNVVTTLKSAHYRIQQRNIGGLIS